MRLHRRWTQDDQYEPSTVAISGLRDSIRKVHDLGYRIG